MFKDRLHQHIKPVGNDHLFKQSPQDPAAPCRQVLSPEILSLPQSFPGLSVHTDGAFHDLGEKSQKQSQFPKMSLDRDLFPVYICHVADGLQCIERDPYRKEKIFDLKNTSLPGLFQKQVGIPGKEIIIFQTAQHSQQYKDSQRQYQPFFFSVFFPDCLFSHLQTIFFTVFIAVPILAFFPFQPLSTALF